ncbi:Tat pathway signal protein [Paeniroseomonas aquatica]|uniref:Tat pathway signal protein n=1 Tax=Paeniroseomonas aquatica TaxID=373043 RepID=A0ABT8ABZ2_9PROT|nr:Tat pathway signal protein [Paeniroseomonas aquatica]MDN3567175.1 Tat pathway signal protein [Paeniroseomonas aquatica]
MRARFLLLLGLALAMAGGLPGGAAPAQAQNRFSLVNSTGQTIERVFVSPSRVSAWGPDVLGQAVLPPGQSAWIVPQQSDCVLDIKVVYQGGREEERRQVNACSLSRVVWGGTPAGAGDPSFQFVNATGVVVNELYVSLSTDTGWGRDRLGQGTLAPGAGLPVSLPAGKVCTVDIRVVYADGRALERRRVETCSLRELNFR